MRWYNVEGFEDGKCLRTGRMEEGVRAIILSPTESIPLWEWCIQKEQADGSYVDVRSGRVGRKAEAQKAAESALIQFLD